MTNPSQEGILFFYVFGYGMIKELDFIQLVIFLSGDYVYLCYDK
jgi:hypothetical protein